jgi:putative oxidoreductase
MKKKSYILLGAILFVNTALYQPFSAVLQSIVVLLLLILFLVVGNGPLQLLKFNEGEKTGSV